ncbi:META domain-containing protein [Marinobacter sp. F4206]|uniref:META domain-containing protein n=1 Tax=Marinobacter sp. F4206 TaxID=2861777 RepID=UPI001C5FEC2B|nr:META domain-containing protein [Marinobacter sp. F4206]MBW4934643.1 META domain-containing protein [Marinobacter sp. F4206]
MPSIRILALPLAVAGLVVSACSTPSGPASPMVNDYACGQLDIQVSADPDSRLLSVDYLDKRMLLKPAEAASGALYVAPGDDSTRLWTKGERAMLSIRGQKYPECLQPGALAMPFSAQGNEPFWRAKVQAGMLEVTRPYEPDAIMSVLVEQKTADRHGREFVGEADGMRAVLTVATQLCQDTMSGVQFPNQARLTLNGEVYEGCGGDPLRLFRGAEWVVDDLAEQGIIDRSRMSVRFLENNRVSGRGSCNRYSGRYEFSGEGGLTFSRLAATRMACAPALMMQEDRFFDVMGRVSGARIGQAGELLLTTPQGEVIKAFQSGHDSP